MARWFILLIAAAIFSTTRAAPSDPNAPKEPAVPFADRGGKAQEGRPKPLGATAAGEKAIDLGLAWLAKRQKKDGSWEYDGSSKDELTAATGMAVLAVPRRGRDAQGEGEVPEDRPGRARLARQSVPHHRG
jgi:hypothetical protein